MDKETRVNIGRKDLYSKNYSNKKYMNKEKLNKVWITKSIVDVLIAFNKSN